MAKAKDGVMKVRLKFKWFAPTLSEKVDPLRSRSGRLFKPGIHDFPIAMKEFLPKGSYILDEEDIKRLEADDLHINDLEKKRLSLEQAAWDMVASAEEKAEVNRLAMIKKLEKARAAKAARREANEAEKKEDALTGLQLEAEAMKG